MRSACRGVVALSLLVAGCALPDDLPQRGALASWDSRQRWGAVADVASDDERDLAWKLELLVPVMDDPDPRVRGAARLRVARLLGLRTPWSASEWLGTDGCTREKIYSLLAFRELGRPMDVALEPLQRIVRDPSKPTCERRDAEMALCALGWPPEGAVERWAAGLDRLDRMDFHEDREIVHALSRLGPRAAAAAPALRRLRARDPAAAFVLEEALARIEPEVASPNAPASRARGP